MCKFKILVSLTMMESIAWQTFSKTFRATVPWSYNWRESTPVPLAILLDEDLDDFPAYSELFAILNRALQQMSRKLFQKSKTKLTVCRILRAGGGCWKSEGNIRKPGQNKDHPGHHLQLEGRQGEILQPVEDDPHQLLLVQLTPRLPRLTDR